MSGNDTLRYDGKLFMPDIDSFIRFVIIWDLFNHSKSKNPKLVRSFM